VLANAILKWVCLNLLVTLKRLKTAGKEQASALGKWILNVVELEQFCASSLVTE